MSIFHWAILFLYYVSSLINGIRWSRIAQREHYIPGSISRFYFRWIKLNKINYFLSIVFLLVIFLSLMYEFASILAIFVGLVFPYGISYSTRTSNIDITPRLKRLFLVYVLFITFVTVLFLATGFGFFGALVSFIFSFFFFDRSLGLMQNIEKALSMKYVTSAADELKKLNGPIIGITGSYSKTTTKEVLTSFLSLSNKVFSTPNSFNNRLGIATAINNENMKDNDLGIFEMGTYGLGEIKEICSWVRPHVSVITGIGPVHLERMKTYENILDAKSEIVEYSGSVVINGDDEMLIERARAWINTKQVIDCSIETNQALVYVQYSSGEHSIYIEGKKIGTVKGPEVHQLSIALSIGVLYVLEQDIQSIINNFDTTKPVEHRQSILTGKKGQKIIDNTFNSNPYSVLSSLNLLKENATEDSKLWLVTPGMVELGSEQFVMNKAFAEEASNIVDEVFVIGLTNKSALKAGFVDYGIKVNYVTNRDEAVKILDSLVNENDVVLFENDLPDHYP